MIIMPRRKRVICLNTGDIYETVSAAAQAEAVNKSSMARMLSGELHTLNGKIFAYYTDEMQAMDPETLIRARKQALNRAYGIVIRGDKESGKE